ncbi:MAG: ATP-binding protein [Pseudomonadales bacterium]|nr:ATP-binding protein [Pseudomonadales bacterium]
MANSVWHRSPRQSIALCRAAVSACLLFIASLSVAQAVAQTDVLPNRILIIHDSGDLGVWRDQFDVAFRDTITESSTSQAPIRVSVIYSGINVYDDQRPESLIAMLKEQHALDPVSVLVAVLPNSVEFAQEYGDEIYPGVPAIYVAPQLSQYPALDSGNDEVVVFSENPASVVDATLRLTKTLIPELSTLYVFSGVDSYGPIQREQVASLVDELLPNVSIRYISGLHISEIADAVTPVPENSAGYLLSYEVDLDGHMFSTLDVLEELNQVDNLPLFGSFDSLHGRGIVGGYMDFAEGRGREAAKVALAMLQGEAQSSGIGTAAYHFDGRQLDRFGISRQLLPQGSVVEFDPFSVWTTYRSQILAAIVVVIIQSLLIAALLLSLKRRKSAEQSSAQHMQELALQKNLFESVINSFPDAILITHADRTIYAANESTKDVFGIGPSEIIGTKAIQHIAFKDDAEKKAEQAMLDGPETELTPIILEFKRSDGSTFAGETIGTRIISSGGEVLGYFSLVRDVTRRLREEQQQRQSQKMEALGNLVGGIAHDFNNVLGVISAYAEINSLTETSEQSKSNLEKIVKATQRGAELCHQILTFSKDMSVDQRPVELEEIVDETSKMLRAMIPNHIELKIRKEGERFSVRANPTQIQQVILNLATNASLAIGEANGEILLEMVAKEVAETLYLSQGTVEPGNYVLLRVTDDGCGMSAEQTTRIFEPFYTTRGGEGTGMGLAIVYKIVRAHRAVMNLQSAEGKGTQFEIYLPLYAGEQDTNGAPKHEELLPGQGEHILLIDDEEELLESLDELLSRIGYQVDAYTDSSEALQQFHKQPDKFDLVISDQVMPGLTGTGLIRAIRERRADLPCIICTGHSDLLKGTDTSNVAVDRVMRKPFTATEMSRSISNLLQSGRSQSANQNSISAVSSGNSAA